MKLEYGKLKLDFGKLSLARLMSATGTIASVPLNLLPLLACLLLYALSVEYVLPFEPAEEGARTRPLRVEFGYLAIPAAIGAAYLFGYAIPAILLALLPVMMFRLHATELISMGPGLDLTLSMILVSALTVYLRDTNFLAKPFRCHDCARAALALAVLYSTFSFGLRIEETLLSLWLGGGFTELMVIVLALLMKASFEDAPLRRFYWLVGAVTLFLFLNSVGVLDLLTGGRGERLTVNSRPLYFHFSDWTRFLLNMLLVGLFFHLIRTELTGDEGRASDGALFAVLAAVTLFYLFRYRLEFGDWGPTLKLNIAVASIFVYLAAGLIGYRMGRAGVAWSFVVIFALVLVASGVNALIPAEQGSTIKLADGEVGEYRMLSSIYTGRGAPVPFILTSVAMAYWGLVLRRRVEALKAPTGSKFLRELSG